MQNYYDIAFTEAAEQRQRDRGSFENYAAARAADAPDALGPYEVDFLEARDSFYLSSVGDDGWPYVQHRGGPVGFVKVIGPAQIAWAERLGNRQYVTAGNLAGNDRVSIIAVDYTNRSRIKLYGHARFEPNPPADVLERFGFDGRMEGLVIVDIVAFDWNCPKYITPRYTLAEIEAVTARAASHGSAARTAPATAQDSANISGV